MRRTDVTLSLLPLGLSEADANAYDEVSVLLTATCSAAATTTTATHASSSAPHTGPGNLRDALTELDQGGRQDHSRAAVALDLLTGVPSSVSAQPPTPSSPASAKVVYLSPPSASAAGAAMEPGELLARLRYLAANHLCEVQRSTVITRALSARSTATASRPHVVDARCGALPRRPSPPPLEEPLSGYLDSADGVRTYCVCPVEEGRYMAAVLLPAVVWHRLDGGGSGGSCGGVLAQWLVHTALQCTPVPISRAIMGDAAVTSAHTPLHRCLTQSPAEVQQRMHVQVQLLAEVSASFASATAAAAKVPALQHQKHWRPEREVALRRLCCEDVSALRTHPRLWRRVEELLRAATSATDAAALRGGMATVGLPAGESRYVAGASAVWFRGSPLYRCSNNRCVDAAYRPCDITALLRTAAVSAVLEEAQAAFGSSSSSISGGAAYATVHEASVRLTTVCLRTNPPTAASAADGRPAPGARSAGYVSAPLRLTAATTAAPPAPADATMDAAPLLLLSFASSSGWTVALLLRAMRTPFLGAPLATVITGVQQLVHEHFESTAFARLVGDATAAMRTAWRRPAELVSPLTAQLQEAIRTIRIARRACPAMAGVRGHVLTPMGDVQLYALTRDGTDAAAEGTAASSALVAARGRSRSRHHDAMASAASPALPPRGRLTSGPDTCDASALQATRGGGGAEVEAVLQAASRYAQLAARVHRCCAGLRRCGGGPSSSILLGAPPRSRTVHSVLTTKQAVHVVQAMPHRSGVGGLHVVTYVVMELTATMVPAGAHEEYRTLAAWMLSRCV